jgi:hypothetical protein
MFPTPPPFLKGACGSYDEDGQDTDRPRVHEARGLDRKKANHERKRTECAMIAQMREHSSV